MEDNLAFIIFAEVHNHPNGTPPSFQDVLYTAKQAADNDTTYRATFVYEAKEDAFYAIYIHDRQKAARFYGEIKEQVDSATMMSKNKCVEVCRAKIYVKEMKQAMHWVGRF